jgi:hypothetical protein
MAERGVSLRIGTRASAVIINEVVYIDIDGIETACMYHGTCTRRYVF